MSPISGYLFSPEIARQIDLDYIKVSPNFLMQGNENLGGLLSAFLAKQMTPKVEEEKKDK